ncbi:MAG TPA: NAD-dependent epimerase/dehydratase family protein [Gemmatimonadales bacterium]|jgi:nucleoside-diphosphate-sugar epimerase|nr:NAD-dependent epimerase/dehydratase family protein [Gemmatimonadales bacterium]
MTVLVTGGGGLVGSHVIEALRAHGEPVRALVRERSRAAVEALGAEAVLGDVTDADAWRRAAAGVQGIVHAAALVAARAPFAEFERVNVGGTRLAIEATRAAGGRARLVHVSSVAVYGRTAVYAAGGGVVDEAFPFHPIPEYDFYARTKRAAEELVREHAATTGISAAAIRPNVIYGERDRLFTPRLVRAVRKGVIPQIGPGRNHLSCVYAGNVAAAVVAALGSRQTGFRAYNVTADAPPHLTQREFFAAFADALRVRLRRIPVPIFVARLGVKLWTRWLRLLDPHRYAGLGGAAVGFLIGENPYSAARARQELGWQPPFDARAAIRRSVTWHTRHRVD